MSNLDLNLGKGNHWQDNRPVGLGYSLRKLCIFCGFLSVVSFAAALGAYSGGFMGFKPLTRSTISSINHWNYSLEDAKRFAYKNVLKAFKINTYHTQNLSFDRLNSPETKPFNINGKDVLVFLHIQKTAGTTFEKFLVNHLEKAPCACTTKKKKCKCYRPNTKGKESHWLFSRYSTGWSCGLHADWTELVVSNCVDNVLDRREGKRLKRRFFYTTFLREPTSRYVSEFRHVNRGATWSQARHICNGRPPTPEELPWCFDPEIGWDEVTLDEFLDCPHNLANNRQTRMLADLTLVGCYNSSSMSKEKRDTLMLESAKRNLEKMAFFGLQEEMQKSQLLFEETLGINFKGQMQDWSKDKSSNTPISEEQAKQIREHNRLDIELYDFAKKLFEKRFKMIFQEGNRQFESDVEQ